MPHNPPTRANKAPTTNPARRPYLPMNSDMGAATSSPDNICIEGGRVAKNGDGASRRPARPPRMINIGMADPRIALAAKMATKFFRASRGMDFGL